MKKPKLIGIVSNGNRLARIVEGSEGEHLIFKKTVNFGKMSGMTLNSRFCVNYCGKESAIKEAEQFVREATR